jgi:hypothetical protein
MAGLFEKKVLRTDTVHGGAISEELAEDRNCS